ncbi:MAG: hypothetical protein JNM14_01910 [Ferruginibacter sp.]|nr:hypothetical protein [Ferruginibacter sp.]
MKKINLLLLLLLFGAATAYSQLQQIKIVSFTVKNQLPPVIDNWGNIPGSLLLVAQLPPNVSVKGIRLIVQIKSNGAIVCGNNSTGGMQVDEFTTRTFSTNELTGTLQGCRDLKEGSYSICVQFFNIDRVAISNEVCKEFSVEPPREIEYTPPTLINPENGKIFTEAELSRPVTFRWTPVVPKPQQPVTYKLKVWQLMQGQNATEAMRTNPPIVTKDVDNITQTVVNGIYTGPCRPPYLCDYVWQVQAVNREGKPIGKNEGRSDTYTFKVETNTNTYAPPQLIVPADAKTFASTEMSGPVMFRWTPVAPKPVQPVVYKLKVWQLMQGQNAAQAMRSNQPIVTKDVDNITQAVVSGIYTGPCRPPYLCDFVWQVQAVDREDKPIGSNEGKSEFWNFRVTEGSSTCPVNISPENNKQFSPAEAMKPMLYKWSNAATPGTTATYRLKVWQLMQGQNATQAMRSNKPVATREVTGLTEATLSGLYTGPCRPPYLCDFVWVVELLDATGKVSCTSESSRWVLDPADPQGNTSCPANISPENNKKFKQDEAKQPIQFRWKAVEPKSQEPITYRLKVWQLMQGQNATQAMAGKPVAEREVVDATEASVAGLYTGPCRPPYLCDFVWQVQALTRDGKPACSANEGKSQPFSFKIQNNIDIQIDSLKVGCCEKGVQSIYIKVRNNLATPVNVVAIKYKVNGVGAAINFVPTSPTLPQNIAGNAFVVFTGKIECNQAINFLKFLVDAEDVADPDNKETEVKSDTLNCMCKACDNIKIQPNEKDKPTVSATAITQNLSFVTGPAKVKSVKMDLVYFEFVPESDDCLVCTTPSAQMGNFSSGSLNNVGGSGAGTHGLSWNFSPPKDMNGGIPLQYSISYPKMVACCGAKAKWCIRYTVTYEDCITCSVVLCYEAAIKGCNK